MTDVPRPTSASNPSRNERVYLDANATEPLRPEALAALVDALALTGNPSSVHAAGRRARQILEDARAALITRFGAADLVFTSGGTEADALAIHGLGGGRRILASAIEHDAVRAAGPAQSVAVDGDGVIDLGALSAALHGPPALVCLMLANNETGTIQPVAAAAELCRRHGAWLHVDAVQAAGRIPVEMRALGADSMAISSHKLGGPAGAGALLLAPDREVRALIAGGGQERGRRGGTPAVAVIAGFAAAAAAAAEAPRDLAGLRDAAATSALAAGARLLGGAHRLSNTACLALPGVPAQTQLIALDLAGVQVSAGAACSSGKVARSHVLAAMGAGRLAGEAIRVSLPWNATAAGVEMFAAAYAAMAARAVRRAA